MRSGVTMPRAGKQTSDSCASPRQPPLSTRGCTGTGVSQLARTAQTGFAARHCFRCRPEHSGVVRSSRTVRRAWVFNRRSLAVNTGQCLPTTVNRPLSARWFMSEELRARCSPPPSHPAKSQSLRLCEAPHNRKCCLFAGCDRGGNQAAVVLTLIRTAVLNDVDLFAWLADILARLQDFRSSTSTICCP